MVCIYEDGCSVVVRLSQPQDRSFAMKLRLDRSRCETFSRPGECFATIRDIRGESTLSVYGDDRIRPGNHGAIRDIVKLQGHIEA